MVKIVISIIFGPGAHQYKKYLKINFCMFLLYLNKKIRKGTFQW